MILKRQLYPYNHRWHDSINECYEILNYCINKNIVKRKECNRNVLRASAQLGPLYELVYLFVTGELFH